MSNITCTKTINNDKYYYLEGKRISYDEATSLKGESELPRCYIPNSITRLKNIKTELKEKTNALSNCKIIEEKYNQLMDLLNSTIEDITILKRVCSLETTFKERSIQLLDLTSILKETEMQLNENNRLIDELKLNSKYLEEENNTLKNQFVLSQGKLKEFEELVNNQNNKELEAKLNSFKDNIKSQEKILSSQSIQITKLTNNLNQCNDKNIEYMEKIKKEANKLNLQKKMIAQVKNENENLKMQLIEFQKLTLKNQTLLKTIADLKQEMKKTSEENKNIISNLEDKVNMNQEKNENLLVAINEMIEKANDRLDNEREKLNEESNNKQKISKKREEQLKGNIMMLEEYINELQIFQEDLNDYENEGIDVEERVEFINKLADRIYSKGRNTI